MPLPSRSGPTLNLSRTQIQLAQPKAPRKLYKTVPSRTSLAEDDQDIQTPPAAGILLFPAPDALPMPPLAPQGSLGQYNS